MASLIRVFISLSVWLLLAASTPKNPDNIATQYYVALVPKGVNPPKLVRLSGLKNDIIVSKTNPGPYKNLQPVNVNYNEDLFLVELQNPASAPLETEVARLANFAIVKLWKTDDQTVMHFGALENFVSKVDLNAPESKNLNPMTKSAPLRYKRTSGDPKITEEELKSMLEEFSGARPVTLPSGTQTITERQSSQKKNLAREWLKTQYEALGFTTSLHEYATGKNFVAERPGSDSSKTLIISAHLDSVGNAGADDDGAGTVSALAIAKSLQGLTLKYNLRILGFDQEESGLIGSRAYARYLSDQGQLTSVVGVINLEMTGYDADNDGVFHAIHCNENTSKSLATAIASAVQDNNLPLSIEDACTNRSDHAAFWRYNVPAIVVSQNFFGGDSNPCYHQACDRVDQINFGYMLYLTKASALAVRGLLVVDSKKSLD